AEFDLAGDAAILHPARPKRLGAIGQFPIFIVIEYEHSEKVLLPRLNGGGRIHFKRPVRPFMLADRLAIDVNIRNVIDRSKVDEVAASRMGMGWSCKSPVVPDPDVGIRQGLLD